MSTGIGKQFISLEIPGKAISLNAVSQSDHWARSNEAKKWREATFWAVKQERPESLRPPYDIFVTHHHANNRLMDHINEYIAVKACIDQLQTMQIIPGDSPRYVRDFTFRQPRNSGRDAIEIQICEV